jgi:hypothetical protein
VPLRGEQREELLAVADDDHRAVGADAARGSGGGSLGQSCSRCKHDPSRACFTFRVGAFGAL